MNQKFCFTVLLWMTIVVATAQVAMRTPTLRFSASAGGGVLFAEGSSAIEGVITTTKTDQLYQSLRSAKNLNGDIHYLIKDQYGIGIKYIFHHTSGDAAEVVVDPGDEIHFIVTDLRESDYLNFAGLSFGGYSAVGKRKRIGLTSSLSAGYAYLRSELSMIGQQLLITGGNFAMNAEIGADYRFHPNLGLGVTLGTFNGTFRKVKITDGTNTREQKLEKDEQYNASNIHLTVGLRYYIQ